MTPIDREQLSEWLSAYLDDELSASDKARLERVLDEEADARRLLAELRRTAGLVASLPRHGAPSSLAEDLGRQLERTALVGEADEEGQYPSAGRGMRRALRFAAAAVFILMVGGGLWALVELNTPSQPTLQQSVATLGPEKDEEMPTGPLLEARRSAASAKKRAASKMSPPSAGKGKKDARSHEPFDESFVAIASFDQKIARDLPEEQLLSHPFVNEPNTLRVTFGDAADRDAAASELLNFLSSNEVVNLRHDSRRSDESLAQESLFYAGQPGVNYPKANDRQLIVRVSAGQVEDLYKELARSRGKGATVALQVGPLQIRGRRQVRSILRQIAKEPGGTDTESHTESHIVTARRSDQVAERKQTLSDAPASRTPPSGVDALKQLLDALGLDQKKLAPGEPSRSDRGGKAETPTLARKESAEAGPPEAGETPETEVVADAASPRAASAADDAERRARGKAATSEVTPKTRDRGRGIGGGRPTAEKLATTAKEPTTRKPLGEKQSAPRHVSLINRRLRVIEEKASAVTPPTEIAKPPERFITLVVHLGCAKKPPTPVPKVKKPKPQPPTPAKPKGGGQPKASQHNRK